MSYDTTNPNLGIAAIFNQNTFKDGIEEDRIGSQKDLQDLIRYLTGLGFDVRAFEDKTLLGIDAELSKSMSKVESFNN